MRQKYSKLALSGLLALGVMAGGMQPAAAGAVQAGGAVSDALVRTASASAGAAHARAEVVEVGGKRHYRGKRHYHGKRHYRGKRSHRPHFRRHHGRYHGPRAGIHLRFGTPSVVVRPRYAQPRYVQPRARQHLPVTHVRWCDRKYRSYRRSDNTFQPYQGPRKQCVSPYL